MTKEFYKRGKKWNREGWVSLGLRDFGLGMILASYRGNFIRSYQISINILFFEFHYDVSRTVR